MSHICRNKKYSICLTDNEFNYIKTTILRWARYQPTEVVSFAIFLKRTNPKRDLKKKNQRIQDLDFTHTIRIRYDDLIAGYNRAKRVIEFKYYLHPS